MPEIEFDWLVEQGWLVSRKFHPTGGLNFEVTNGLTTITLYRPKDRSLVFLTTYSLSERQLIRLLALNRSQYLDLIWKLKTLIMSNGFILELLPRGAELNAIRIGTQIWEPDINKNNVLSITLRMLNFPELIHAFLESQLSVIVSWELESFKALVQPPGDKPTVWVIP